MKTFKGISLIEIIVVAAIVLLVASLAAVAVSAARSKQRDATRLSNVRQVQSALENYFNESNEYPIGSNLPLGDGMQSRCLSLSGFQADCSGESSIFLRVVTGTYQDGLADLVTCGEVPSSAFCYTQTDEGLGYQIEFELENALSLVGLIEGVNCATPSGIEGGACE